MQDGERPRRRATGGMPRPWESGGRRELQAMASTYYLEVLAAREAVLAAGPTAKVRERVEQLTAVATRCKHEVDDALSRAATAADRARLHDRLGCLARTSRQLRRLADTTPGVR
jgi:hypothetical protein